MHQPATTVKEFPPRAPGAGRGGDPCKKNARPEAVPPARGRAASLSTSHISPHPRQKGPKRLNQAEPYVRSAVGGSTSKLSFGMISEGDGRVVHSRTSRRPRGGGRRKKIKAFSRASRLRLLRLMASINWDRFQAKAFSVTLTYPGSWPKDPATWKKDLDTFGKRLKRRYPTLSSVWRMEFQGRGAPHFHLIIFLPRPLRTTSSDLRRFVARSWYEACGKLCDEHLKAGTEVRPISSPTRLNRYARYMAKTEKLQADVPDPGRLWGVWGRNRLPVDWETVKLGVEQAFRLRRVLRRLARLKGRGPLRSMQVFVRYETVQRLLSFMSCYRG